MACVYVNILALALWIVLGREYRRAIEEKRQEVAAEEALCQQRQLELLESQYHLKKMLHEAETKKRKLLRRNQELRLLIAQEMRMILLLLSQTNRNAHREVNDLLRGVDALADCNSVLTQKESGDREARLEIEVWRIAHEAKKLREDR